MFHFFQKVNKGQLGMVNCQLQKWPVLDLFNKIIKRPGTSFPVTNIEPKACSKRLPPSTLVFDQTLL